MDNDLLSYNVVFKAERPQDMVRVGQDGFQDFGVFDFVELVEDGSASFILLASVKSLVRKLNEWLPNAVHTL